MRKLLILLLFASCISQKKVEKYLEKHKDFTADFCSDKFPVWERVDTILTVDTGFYEQAYNEMWHFTDSLLTRIDDLENTKEFMYIPVKTNMDSLAEVVKAFLRRSLKPCKDSIMTVTRMVEDKARVQQLTQEIATLKKDNDTYKAIAKLRLRFLLGIATALFVLIAFNTKKYWL